MTPAGKHNVERPGQQKVRANPVARKDEEAEQFLKQEALPTSPDAQYILAQTVLVQNIALEQAKAQMQQLQDHLEEARTQLQQPPAPAQHTSFLGSLLGRHDVPPPPPQGFSPQGFPPRPAAAPQYYPPAPAYAPEYAAAPPTPPPSSGLQLLRSAATTAAGVAAGALAFEGVESILHGFGHGGGGFGGSGFGGGGFGGDRPVEETVVSNSTERPKPEPRGRRARRARCTRSTVTTASATKIAAHSSTTPATTLEIL